MPNRFQPSELITRDALNRIEDNAKERISALRELTDTRLLEHERQIRELNNSHNKAVEEKQRTDTEALRVQERTVTKTEFQAWKEVVDKNLSEAKGAAAMKATVMSIGIGFGVLVVGQLLRYFFPVR